MIFNLFKKKDYRYELIEANHKYLDIITNYKIEDIKSYDTYLEPEEKTMIEEDVLFDVVSNISDFKMIKINKDIIGTVGVLEYKDGFIIDSIFINKEYRNKGIGSAIIKELIDKYKTLYLCVYEFNFSAISLFERLGFKSLKKEQGKIYMIKK